MVLSHHHRRHVSQIIRHCLSVWLTTCSIPVSIWSLKNVPNPEGEEADVKHKWKRLDLQGSLM